MNFLITAPSGFEKQAIKEIEKLLENGSASTTYFKGLLFGKADLEKAQLLETFRNADTSYINKIIPVDKIVPSDLRDMKEFFKGTANGRKFAVRCERRGNHEFSSRDVEMGIGQTVKENGGIVDLKNPELLLMVNVIQEYACLSVLLPSEIIKKEPKVTRKWKKGERPVSRAELKMREIMEKFPELFESGFVALDIGAAPGGWTRAMSEKVRKVIAVDAAELNEEVAKKKNVLHLKHRAENLELDEKVDLITNDANILHFESATLSANLARKFLKKGGILIQTIKLGIDPQTGKRAAKDLNLAVEEVRQELEKAGIEVICKIKLKYNTRNEITVIGKAV